MKFTNVSEFVFPLLGISPHLLKTSRQRFSNCYLTDERFDKDFLSKSYVILVHSGHQDSEYRNFEKKITALPNYVESYDVDPSGKYIGRIFTIPTEFEDDFELFKKGKYSQMSHKAKKRIIENSITKDLGSKLFKVSLEKAAKGQTTIQMIFNKHIFLREQLEDAFEVSVDKDQELWSKPEINIGEVNFSDYEKTVVEEGVSFMKTKYENIDIITNKLVESLKPSIKPNLEFEIEKE